LHELYKNAIKKYAYPMNTWPKYWNS